MGLTQEEIAAMLASDYFDPDQIGYVDKQGQWHL